MNHNQTGQFTHICGGFPFISLDLTGETGQMSLLTDGFPFVAPFGVTPAAPTGLIAAATGPFQATLWWTDTSSDETSFIIERSASGSGPFVTIATVAPNTSKYVDNTVVSGATYFYRVLSLVDYARSDSSDTAFVLIPQADTDGFIQLPLESFADGLPTWFPINLPGDQYSTGYGKTFMAVSDALSKVSDISLGAQDLVCLGDRTDTWPRNIWRCPSRPEITSTLSSVTITRPGDEIPITARRVISQGIFLFADDPVFVVSDDNYLYFRNIAQTTCSVLVEDTPAQLPHGNLMPDETVYIMARGKWRPVPPELVDHTLGTVATGELGLTSFKYSTIYFADAPRVSVGGDPEVALTRHDAWNPHDEAALFVSLSRQDNEANLTLSSRTKVGYLLARLDNAGIEKPAIGHELGFVGTVSWDGQSTIDFANLGINGVTHISVVDTPRTRTSIDEQLYPDRERISFASAAKSWRSGWMIFVNGTRVTQKTYSSLDPAEVGTSGIVDFGQRVEGLVTATYSAENYKVTINRSTGSATLEPTGNTPPGDYTVLYVREIEARVADDPSLGIELLDENGRPSRTYVLIARATQAAAPITIGNCAWGPDTHWFDDTEAAPEISHLPVPIQ
jgi:hypothetical protein